MESHGIAAAVRGRKEKLLLIRGISDLADADKNDKARLSAMEGPIRFFDEALRRKLLRPADAVKELAAPSKSAPREYTLKISERVFDGGVANNYVQITRSTVFIDEVDYRKSVLKKMADKFPTMHDLREFCIVLNIDFDEIPGITKSQKAAGILDHVEKRKRRTVATWASLAIVGFLSSGNRWKYGFASSSTRAKEGRAMRRSR
jgi:hypothetical protein